MAIVDPVAAETVAWEVPATDRPPAAWSVAMQPARVLPRRRRRRVVGEFWLPPIFDHMPRPCVTL